MMLKHSCVEEKISLMGWCKAYGTQLACMEMKLKINKFEDETFKKK